MSSSLVVQTSFLGDTVLTTPLLVQLANRGPVDVVTTPAAAALLANHPAVHTLIAYDKRGADSGLVGLWSLARRLRATRYDVAFLAQGSWRSAALAWLAGIPTRVGFSTSAGRLLYTKRVTYRDDLHHAARLLMLARPNGREPTPAELHPSLVPGDVERDAVDAFLRARGVRPDEPLIALAPGSVWATKRWPFYPELAQELADAAAHSVPDLADAVARIVIVGSAADTPLAAAVVAAVPSAIDATGHLSLLASAELIGRSRVLVTNDSAPMHLASAMGTPTVAIFGPTVPGFGFGPLASRASVVGHDTLPCRPCDRHGPRRCPLGHHRCMRELTPSAVAERARALLLTPDVHA